MDLDALCAHLKFVRGKKDDFILARRNEIEANPLKYNATTSPSGVITLWVRMLPEVAADDILLVTAEVDKTLKDLEAGFDLARLLDMDDTSAAQLHADISGTSSMVGCVQNAVDCSGSADIAAECIVGRRRRPVQVEDAGDCQPRAQHLEHQETITITTTIINYNHYLVITLVNHSTSYHYYH